jgi:small subunit ribosomal protein S2
MSQTQIDSMFKAGAHYAYSRSRRHPSIKPYIFGAKNRVEIFDLEKTAELLAAAKAYVASVAASGKQILFVGSKNEARNIVTAGAGDADLPFVAGRWLGGTLTNFGEIKRRIDKLAKLTEQRAKGELSKYTKKERLLIDREIAKLERFFSGISSMKELPKAIFVIDSKKEKNAVAEAKYIGIPVIALMGSDCDFKDAEYPVVANDSTVSSISYFVKEIASAYKTGKASAPAPVAKQ